MRAPLFLAAAIVALAACKRDKPHVPYTIDTSALPSAAPTGAAGGGAPSASAAVNKARPAGAGAGVSLVKLAYEEGDVLSLEPGKDARERALVLRRKGSAEAETVTAVQLTGGEAACQVSATLVDAGRRSVAVTARLECPGPSAGFEASTRTSEVALVSFARTRGGGGARTTRMRLEHAPGAPDVRVRAEGADLDGDGHDDAQWLFELGTAKLSFRELDVASGMSPDLDEPDASLKKALASARARVGKPKLAAAVAAEIASLALLHAYVCGSHTRVTHDGRLGLACGATTLEELVALESLAALGAGELAHGINAYERGVAHRTGELDARYREVRAAVERAVPVREASFARYAAPWEPPTFRPQWRVSFDGDDVLVRTKKGAARIFAGGESKELEEEAASVAGAAGAGFRVKRWTWSDAFDPGDGVSVHATFVAAEGDRVADVALPVPGAVRPPGKGKGLPVVPFYAPDDVLYLLVGTESVRIGAEGVAALALPRDGGRAPGSPASSTGMRWVTPTSLGLFVQGDKTPTLVRARELEGAYASLTSCTISDSATKVACMRGSNVVVLSLK